MSFGYHRAEVLGAMASILFIWGLLIWLIIEATSRLIHGSEIEGLIMLITASVGLGCNLINIFVLERVGESRDVIETTKGSEISQTHCH
jgi:zinc transporter 2